MTIGAFLVFVGLWAGFVYSLIVDPTLPGQAWAWLRGLDAPVQAAVWVAILPMAVGLWAWVSTWPLPVGILLGLGIVAWSVAAMTRMLRLALTRR